MDVFENIMITFFAGFVLFIPIYAYITCLISKKKMETGIDKRKIQYVLKDIVPKEENYTVAYASWYSKDYPGIGRYYITSNWHYAIGFNRNRIYTVPLMLDAGDIYYRKYRCIDKTMISVVKSEPKYGKITLYDRSGRMLIHLKLETENYGSGSDSIHIYQKEEVKAFWELMGNWAAEINPKVSMGN